MPPVEDRELYERLTVVETCVKNMDVWQNKLYAAIEKIDLRTLELKEDLAVWKDRAAGEVKHALAQEIHRETTSRAIWAGVVAFSTALTMAVITWLLRKV